MLKVLGCIAIDHDLRLVVLAGLVCAFASFTAVELLSHARLAQGRARALWTAATGTVAGCGIWATHFVAMLAYETSLPIAYDLWLTALSIVVAVSLATAAVWLTLYTQSGLLGGALLGAAIGSMHFIGMAALRGPFDVSWDATYVAASLVLGPTLSAAAVFVALRRRSMRDDLVAAGLLTLGICTLHFTAMTAVSLTLVADASPGGSELLPTSLAVAVAAIAMLIVGLAFVGVVVDRHLGMRAQAEAERLRAHVAELELTKENLEKTSRELTAALTAASQSSQAKSQFLAAMSHELRTPLNAIIGYSELMRMEVYGPVGDQRYTQYLCDINASGAHLLALINDVLDLARLDSNRMELEEEPVNLRELIEESVRFVTPQAGQARLSVETKAPFDLPSAMADRRRLKQVLINLLSNAVKFTPGGGHVSVTASVRTDGSVAIAVSDTGIGMREEDIPLAMSRFGQVDAKLSRRFEGTGLGLPLAKDIIEVHGGTCTIQSVLGVGTTVTVTLPAERVVVPRAALVANAR